MKYTFDKHTREQWHSPWRVDVMSRVVDKYTEGFDLDSLRLWYLVFPSPRGISDLSDRTTAMIPKDIWDA
jgi:hypothetical protein